MYLLSDFGSVIESIRETVINAIIHTVAIKIPLIYFVNYNFLSLISLDVSSQAPPCGFKKELF